MNEQHIPEHSLTDDIVQEMLSRIESLSEIPPGLAEALRKLTKSEDIKDWEKVKQTFVSFEGESGEVD